MRIRGWKLGFPVVAILAPVVALAFSGQVAWGATGSLGGSAQPQPSNTSPVVGDVYDIQLVLANTSLSTSIPPGTPNFISVNVASALSPPNPDEVAHIVLACSSAPCSGVNQLPGTLTFLPQGATGCVSGVPGVVSCEIDPLNSNRVIIKTTPNTAVLGPLQLNFVLATIRVRQDLRPPSFIIQGDVALHGTTGTCSGGQCDNVSLPNTCTLSTPDCDFSSIAGTAVGTASILPVASCGDSILDPGETCDPPGSVQPGGAICRADCTFCGDGTVQAADGEQCDDGNNTSGDGCSATCQTELCQIKVDKQVSCDGVTWADAGLELNNEDGTNGVSCPKNGPVFVRYQLQNTGAVNVANCTVGESNAQIAPGGTVLTAPSLLAGAGVGPTSPLNPQCTDALAASEPDSATASCECQVSQGGPLTATATDTAQIVCQSVCGDGIVDPGETCDPPGTPEPNGNVCRADCTFCGDGITQPGEACDPNNPADPVTAAGRCSTTCTVLSICGDGIVDPGETCDPPGSTLPGGAICRDDCTFCGDGLVQARDGEQCDDGNNRNGDGCSATCDRERLVPTLSGWGMLLFVVLLLGVGSVTMTRRRRNVAPR